ncbi:hypothetical protein ASG25_04880 [Rhizobium sp. Leaf384]|uniref:nuclear transport factor 2 family protein n=1 Tax=unclassified Rhizobium TaxID=2613769 RepID=UPI000714DA9F|nr:MULTISPECIES: nuclear transport factor 2 family protein [unclassified Rhizobium]KQS80867.1 hypothetical protein ASG25_04880 [Rhizobium sp. Leaf384]KQS86727.1 hypothetical protein ASG58_00180 [Rhizobium sp. Leaf383]
MTMRLPKPIADYVDANARLDIDGMMQTFLDDALLIDNGRRYAGLAEIRKRLKEEAIAVGAIFTPDAVREDDGDVVLEGPVHGDFPGSPIRFTYRVTLANDAIKTLEMTA